MKIREFAISICMKYICNVFIFLFYLISKPKSIFFDLHCRYIYLDHNDADNLRLIDFDLFPSECDKQVLREVSKKILWTIQLSFQNKREIMQRRKKSKTYNSPS